MKLCILKVMEYLPRIVRRGGDVMAEGWEGGREGGREGSPYLEFSKSCTCDRKTDLSWLCLTLCGITTDNPSKIVTYMYIKNR